MVDLISPPDPRALLPPLLACLPPAFASPTPPPAFLPLLSPILRQRVQFLGSVSASPSESWLRLLCWDAGKAEHLQNVVDGTEFEPHPVSGEIELHGEVPVVYKRVDDETLYSRMVLPDYGLIAVYLWCPNDQDGGGPGWRLAELLPEEGSGGDEAEWSLSIGEARSRSQEQMIEDALRAAERREPPVPPAADEQKEDEEDDDDDYWAQYDATPGRTPAVKTPAPNPVSSLQQQNASEASYFSRYADVQPALDNHDPEEEQPEVGPSSLNGDMLASLLQRQINGSGNDGPPPVANGDSTMPLNHPRPSSTPSMSSEAVSKLEQEAENQSSGEIAVKQHISSNLKSLFRLAKATGISRADFQSLVQTELELLNVSDHD